MVNGHIYFMFAVTNSEIENVPQLLQAVPDQRQHAVRRLDVRPRRYLRRRQWRRAHVPLEKKDENDLQRPRDHQLRGRMWTEKQIRNLHQRR